MRELTQIGDLIDPTGRNLAQKFGTIFMLSLQIVNSLDSADLYNSRTVQTQFEVDPTLDHSRK